MKKLTTLLALAFAVVLLAGCVKKAPAPTPDEADNQPAEENVVEDTADTEDADAEANDDTAEVEDNAEYEGVQVDTTQSILKWTGNKVGGNHYGTVDIKNGVLRVDENGNLVDGAVVIDMETIVSENEAVTNHLNNEDFFDVPNHPIAQLKINMVDAGEEANTYEATADLTIKGITNDIKFPVTWEAQEDGTYKGTAKFTIDRTRWDITFRSLRFFSDVADRAIDDMIEFDVTIVTK